MAFLDTFGFWKKEKEDQHKDKANKESIEVKEDGSFNFRNLHGVMNFSYDMDFKTYSQQVETYRRISEIADVDEAITEICNDSINFEDDDLSPIEISLDETEFSENIQKKILEEFEYLLETLEFSTDGWEQFKQWYVEGVSYYHKIIDPNNTKKGILNIVKLDSAKIGKIKEIEKDANQKISKVDEYFVYDEQAGDKKKYKNEFSGDHIIKFPKESIAYVDSGIYDRKYGFPKSHIHKAIRPVNNLISVEVSAVIYRVSRSSEKRIFYVDTGRLQGAASEQYVKNLMQQYRNKITYNQDTGEFSGSGTVQHVLEDIWLPRKGGKNTEVTTLPGGQNLGEMDDVEYMLKKLYRSLNVPTSRMTSESLVTIGNIGEIDREELKFSKFIKRIRKRFNILFLDLLQTQLLLKKIITDEEWRRNKQKIKFIYNQDLYISEQKEAAIMRDRFELADTAQSFVGKYLSNDFVRRHILKQTDQEIDNMDKAIEEEKNNSKYKEQEDDFGEEETSFGSKFNKKEPQDQEISKEESDDIEPKEPEKEDEFKKEKE